MGLPGTGRGAWAGVAALCLVQFVDVLGVTVIVAALPAMLSDLHASADAGSLIATGYAMFFGGLLMLGARLGDRYGQRRVILVGMALFALAAALGATAASVPMLTASRCLQGAAAAISVPSALHLLTALTPEGSSRRRAVALWSAAGAAAGASGFVVGGIVTQLAGWRVVMWAYLPLAIALAVAIRASVPADAADRTPVTLQGLSATTFTTATMLFVIATTLIPERGRIALGIALLAAAAAVATLWTVAERRAAAPLLPPAARAQRALRQGSIASFLNTAATSSAVTLATLYLQNARGRTPLAAALLLLPFSLAVIAGSALAARALSTCSPQQVIAAGLSLITVGDVALVPLAPSIWPITICVALGGAGIGASSVAATGLATSVPEAIRATASGAVNTAAQLGTALGVALVLLVAGLTTGAAAPGTPSPWVGWLLAAAVSAGGAIGFARARANDDEPRQQWSARL